MKKSRLVVIAVFLMACQDDRTMEAQKEFDKVCQHEDSVSLYLQSKLDKEIYLLKEK